MKFDERELSQQQCVLNRLKSGRKVSQLSALRDFGCMRLAAIIYRLRRQGHKIITDERKQGGKRYAVYRLENGADA